VGQGVSSTRHEPSTARGGSHREGGWQAKAPAPPRRTNSMRRVSGGGRGVISGVLRRATNERSRSVSPRH